MAVAHRREQMVGQVRTVESALGKASRSLQAIPGGPKFPHRERTVEVRVEQFKQPGSVVENCEQNVSLRDLILKVEPDCEFSLSQHPIAVSVGDHCQLKSTGLRCAEFLFIQGSVGVVVALGEKRREQLPCGGGLPIQFAVVGAEFKPRLSG